MLTRLPFVGLLLMSAIGIAQENTAATSFASSTPTVSETNAVDDATVSTIVNRALPYIERHGVAWMTEKKCATCHHSTFMVWSFNAAADRGIAVDESKVTDWNVWVRNFRRLRGGDRDTVAESEAPATFVDNPDAVGQLLIGRGNTLRASANTEQENEWSQLMTTHLLDAQQEDGSWKAGGQLPGQKRPIRETTEVTTLGTLLALNAAREPDDAVRAADERAAAWLGEETVGVSAEWWTVKLLWERRCGHEDEANGIRADLLRHQHADGGWGWLLEEQSDALATGMVLYALQRDGLSRSDESISRAIEFLRSTQQPDGSWPVQGTKENKRTSIEPTTTFWGTCWATIGLLESLPVKKGS